MYGNVLGVGQKGQYNSRLSLDGPSVDYHNQMRARPEVPRGVLENLAYEKCRFRVDGPARFAEHRLIGVKGANRHRPVGELWNLCLVGEWHPIRKNSASCVGGRERNR